MGLHGKARRSRQKQGLHGARPAHTRTWTPGLLNCEQINFDCFQPPDFRHLVMAGSGS